MLNTTAAVCVEKSSSAKWFVCRVALLAYSLTW